MLDKLQKWICKTIGYSLGSSLEALAHRRNIASLSLFYRHYFVKGFFNFYLAVPWPTLGHYQEVSLTHPMLITGF